MKLDNDPGFRLPSPPRKSYNPFDSDDDSPRTVPANSFIKDNKNFHLKEYETTPDPLAAYVSNTADLSWEEAILGHPKVDNHAINADADGHRDGLFEKETEVYTDKTVTECELPEFVVCYKENSYQSVKDIGIDEGVPMPDNIWVKRREDMNLPTFMDLNGGGPTGSDSSTVDKDGQVDQGLQCKATEEPFTKDLVKMNAPNPGRPDVEYLPHRSETDDAVAANVMEHDLADGKPLSDLCSKGFKTVAGGIVSGVANSNSPEGILEVDASVRRDSDLMHNHQNKHDVSDLMHDHRSSHDFSVETRDHHNGHAVADRKHDDQNGHHVFDLTHDHRDSLDVADSKQDHQTSHDVAEKGGVTYGCEEETIAKKIPSVQVLDPKDLIPQAGTSDAEETRVEPSQNQTEEATLPQTPDLSTADEACGSNTKAVTYDSKIEPGSITFDFNSSDPLTPPGRAQEEKTEHVVEIAPQTQTMTRDSSEPASIAELDQRVHGETSFSSGAPPASITYTGPIAYSGSISLRSESSAGSTRSFAFPVLQTEWNSSPVRMAKADQRHFRKHKGWVESVLCCRF